MRRLSISLPESHKKHLMVDNKDIEFSWLFSQRTSKQMPDWKKTAQACLGICLDSQWGWHGWLYPVSKSLSFRLHQSRAWSNRITRTTRWYFAMAAFLAHRPTRSEVWSLRKWAKVKQWIFADCDPNQKKSKGFCRRWKLRERKYVCSNAMEPDSCSFNTVTMWGGREVTMFRDKSRESRVARVPVSCVKRIIPYHCITIFCLWSLLQTRAPGSWNASLQFSRTLGAKRAGITPVSGGSETASSASTQNSKQRHLWYGTVVPYISLAKVQSDQASTGVTGCFEHSVPCE